MEGLYDSASTRRGMPIGIRYWQRMELARWLKTSIVPLDNTDLPSITMMCGRTTGAEIQSCYRQ